MRSRRCDRLKACSPTIRPGSSTWSWAVPDSKVWNNRVMVAVKELADRYHSGWLAAHPFDASYMGVPGYDDAVPDDSPAGEDRRRSEVEAVLVDAGSIDPTRLDHADTVTLGCIRS